MFRSVTKSVRHSRFWGIAPIAPKGKRPDLKDAGSHDVRKRVTGGRHDARRSTEETLDLEAETTQSSEEVLGHDDRYNGPDARAPSTTAIAQRDLRCGGHVFDLEAKSRNLASFIRHTGRLTSREAMSDEDRANHVRKAILAFRKGFVIEAEMLGHLQEVVQWVKPAHECAKSHSATRADLGCLRAAAESMADTLKTAPSVSLVAGAGKIPSYTSDAMLLAKHAGGPYIKERKHPLIKGRYFRLKTPKATSEPELVLALRDAVKKRPAGFGAKQQFRLCADVMLEKGLTGPEGFQFLAHAVEALRTTPTLVQLDVDKAKALFTQCRGMWATGVFGASTEAAASWLFELGQLVAGRSHSWGSLEPLR
jgi:hypothetical protein